MRQNGDMVAQDTMYYKVCLSNLYKKAPAKLLVGYFTDHERKLHGIAF